MTVDSKRHWENVYLTKSADAVSWYQPTARRSLELVRRVASDLTTPVIDVGGGASVLVDDLLHAGYSDLTILDLSAAALATARARLGNNSARVRWIEADVRTAQFSEARYGVWHDRAVFHFLTDAHDRAAYVSQVKLAVRPGGYVLVSTFGPDGPERCSGLEVCRYSSDELHTEFGPGFVVVATDEEVHETPSGAHQAFIYCLCRWEGGFAAHADPDA